MTDAYLKTLHEIAVQHHVKLRTVVMLAREKNGEIVPYYPERNQHTRRRKFKPQDLYASQGLDYDQDFDFDISWATA